MAILDHQNTRFKLLLAVPLVTTTLFLASSLPSIKQAEIQFQAPVQVQTQRSLLKAHINPYTGDFTTTDTALESNSVSQVIIQPAGKPLDVRSSQPRIKVRLGIKTTETTETTNTRGVFNNARFIRTPASIKSQLVANIDHQQGVVFSHKNHAHTHQGD